MKSTVVLTPESPRCLLKGKDRLIDRLLRNLLNPDTIAEARVALKD